MTVTRPGLLTTVQDLGRWGWQAEGVPVSGAMDPWSLSAANLLVGNDVNCAALEVTLIGPELVFDDECVVALTGAEFAVTMNGTAVVTGRPFVVPKGGRLRFGERRRGARAYVALGGGIDVASILGSRSTHVRSRMGGVDGRALVPGDRLPLASSRGTTPADLRTARHDVSEARLESSTTHSNHARVRVLAGPQRDRFTSNALDVLQSAPYTLTQESDRMGFRLSGPRLEHTRGADIISDATPLGALQVPGEGQPLLLMAERQTTGGYPKLATVISADIGIAGQLAPGDRISFELCSMKDAMSALIARERALMTVRG